MWFAVECAGVIWNGECSAKCGGSSVESCVTRCGGAMWCGVECGVIMQYGKYLWCCDVDYGCVVMWNTLCCDMWL